VSAKLAQRAKSAPDASQRAEWLATSGILGLEKFIHDTMDDRARLQLKFANPLGVAAHVVDTQEARAHSEADALLEDKETVAAVEAVITGYERELKAELPSRL